MYVLAKYQDLVLIFQTFAAHAEFILAKFNPYTWRIILGYLVKYHA